MNTANALHKLNTARRVRQTLRKDPANVAALLELAEMLGDLETPDLAQKRELLKRVLALEPANSRASQMLLDMDRAAIGGNPSRLSPAVILTPPCSNELYEKPLTLRYSILHRLLVYPSLALCLWLMFAARANRDAFLVFAGLFLLLLIPVWFVSAVLEVDRSGLRLSRFFGVYRLEMEWKEIECTRPGPLGVGIKLSAVDGRSMLISSQMHGYSSIVEILRQMRPDLFGAADGKVFRKGFLARYGLLLFVVPATPLALAEVFVPPFLPGILASVPILLLWRQVL